MPQKQDKIRIGTFQIGEVATIGHILLDGERTTVGLSANKFYHFGAKEEKRIHGVLTDHEKITLVDCITTSIPGTTSTPNGQSFHASVFPHYIVTGNKHIEPDVPNISAVEFVLENAHVLFWDHEAFGASRFNSEPAKEFLKQMVSENKRETEIGQYPQLLYFTGKHEILSSQTSLGKISAGHCPTFTSPTPKGLRIENRIPIRIEFETSLPFEDALNRAYAMRVFADLLMGGEQRTETLTIELAGDQEIKERLNVYQSMAPHPADGQVAERPHPGDVLINGGIDPAAFSNVLASWLLRQADWRVARFRFIQSFRAQNSYTIDRLVAAANLFDIIPANAVGVAQKISDQLSEATEKARSLFKTLPESPERDSVLGALGRVGNHNLRSKVEHRAKLITDKTGERFKEMNVVISAAVAARNYFVHGSSSFGKLTAEDHHEFSVFFTDTLEFIFAASDLIEAGWDIGKWNSAGTTLSHPFGRYRTGYDENLASLKARLAMRKVKS